MNKSTPPFLAFSIICLSLFTVFGGGGCWVTALELSTKTKGSVHSTVPPIVMI
jgi:hypothetical protein